MSKAKAYIVQEIFYSIQGEGAHAGRAAVFVRFAGCNLRCRKETHGFDCDTQFSNGKPYTRERLIEEAKCAGGACRFVVLTGGEPALQVDQELVDELHAAGFEVAIETNGTCTLPKGIDWVAISPKRGAVVVVTSASEVKHVLRAGDRLPEPACVSRLLFLSPAADGATIDREALAWCVNLVKENPQWRLSMQQHKIWNIP
jgi:organic radical activating enzyme